MTWTWQEYQNYVSRKIPQLTYTSGIATREADLHQQIIDHCAYRGWLVLHSRMDMRCTQTVGSPDFTILLDGGRILFVECKTKDGKLSREQAALHAWAQKLGHIVHVVRSAEQFWDLISTRFLENGK